MSDIKFKDIYPLELEQIEPDAFYHDKTHTYWLNGERVLSNTQILELAGYIDKSNYQPHHAARGTRVHQGVHFLAEGELEWSTVSPQDEPYIRSYEKAIAELGFKIVACEKIYINRTYRLGTRIDQEIIQLSDGREGVLELKSGYMQPWTAYQTTLQVMTKWPDSYYDKVRIGMELKKDGSKARIERYTDINDFNIAIAAIVTAYDKQKNWGNTNGISNGARHG